MTLARRQLLIRLLAASLVLAGIAVAVESSRAASVSQLGAQLGQVQARQQSLSASVGRLSGLIGSLDSQIELVQSREAAVQADLGRDRAALARIRALLAREQRLVALMRARLARARAILAQQLVSSYESDRPDLVSVLLESQGFADLLEQLDFLRRAEQEQQSAITTTEQAKAQADAAERHLAGFEATDLKVTQAAAVRVRALAGMNALLQSRQAALARAGDAQQAALVASRARGRQLQAAIATLQAQQAAAEQANASLGSVLGAMVGPSGEWAIPDAIVLCESGGQNLPPNSAGASGYYQILPATWRLYGGNGAAAYLASKAEQDAVAARIWNRGAGASNWVCAGIVGIR